ncbi:unnamed protein product, partial [Prorocentrum cordatum]
RPRVPRRRCWAWRGRRGPWSAAGASSWGRTSANQHLTFLPGSGRLELKVKADRSPGETQQLNLTLLMFMEKDMSLLRQRGIDRCSWWMYARDRAYVVLKGHVGVPFTFSSIVWLTNETKFCGERYIPLGPTLKDAKRAASTCPNACQDVGGVWTTHWKSNSCECVFNCLYTFKMPNRTHARTFTLDRCGWSDRTLEKFECRGCQRKAIQYELRFSQGLTRGKDLSAECMFLWPVLVFILLYSVILLVFGVAGALHRRTDATAAGSWSRARWVSLDPGVLLPALQALLCVVGIVWLLIVAEWGEDFLITRVILLSSWLTLVAAGVLRLLAEVPASALQGACLQLRSRLPIGRSRFPACGGCSRLLKPMFFIGSVVPTLLTQANALSLVGADSGLVSLLCQSLSVGALCWASLACTHGKPSGAPCLGALDAREARVLVAVVASYPLTSISAALFARYLRLSMYLKGCQFFVQMGSMLTLTRQLRVLVVSLAAVVLCQLVPHASLVWRAGELLPVGRAVLPLGFEKNSPCDYGVFDTPVALFDGKPVDHVAHVLKHTWYNRRPFFWLSQPVFDACDTMINAKGKVNRVRYGYERKYPSTGCVAFVLATQLCKSVSLYGFGPDSTRDAEQPANANGSQQGPATYSLFKEKAFLAFHDFGTEHAIISGFAHATDASGVVKQWSKRILNNATFLKQWKGAVPIIQRGLSCAKVQYPGPGITRSHVNLGPCKSEPLLRLTEEHCVEMATVALGGQSGWAATGPKKECDVYETCTACDGKVGDCIIEGLKMVRIESNGSKGSAPPCERPELADGVMSPLITDSARTQLRKDLAAFKKAEVPGLEILLRPDALHPERARPWDTCAIVGSGSELAGQKAGAAIDAHEQVWRLNTQVVHEMYEDLGRKTTLIISNHHAWRRICYPSAL